MNNTTSKKMTGLFNKLSPEQQRAALEYRGEETCANPDAVAEMANTVERKRTAVDRRKPRRYR
jgi:hypothetical protein